MLRPRHYTYLATAFAAVRGWAAAPETGPALDAQIAALLAAQPRWSVSASLDAAYGYRDNLLLSRTDEERSGFVRGVAEVVLLRVPTGPLEFSYFLQGERTQFFERETVEKEARAWSQAEFGWRIGEPVRLALPVTGYYIDQVFDVSDTEVERTIAELRVKGGMLGPQIRWTVRPGLWLEAQGTGDRKRYEDGANDGTVGEGAARAGWQATEKIELRLSATRRWRNFDHRARYSAAGRELTGTELKIAEQEVQGRVSVKWDRAGTWQTHTAATELHYRDNGSGYFNYRERRLEQELEWNGGPWRVRATLTAARVDFGVQTVGLGLNPDRRIKDEYAAELRVERTLSAAWTLLAAYAWERNRSNDVLASYRLNEGLLGLRWSWER